MEKSTLHITFFTSLLGCTSILYFFSLLVHLPVVATLALVFLTTYFLYRFFCALHLPDPMPLAGLHQKLSSFLFLACICILVNKSFYLALKEGQWDAWAIWNLNALYLKDGHYWSRLTINATAPHPDYPLFLPSIIGFTWRLLQSTSFVIPYIFSFLTALFIPSLIFLQLYRKSLFVATLLLLWFVTDDFFLTRTLAQYADQWVALFFLLAFISIDVYKSTGEKRFITICAFMLGCCCWTKNEGFMLAIIFIALYSPTLLRRSNISGFLLGIAFPLLFILIFKLAFAPTNDLVAKSQGSLLPYFTDTERYKLIWEWLQKNFRENFPYHRFALPVFLLACIIRRVLPGRNMLIILLCFCGFMLVYVVTPYDLQWHLLTSLERVLFQLSPVFIYEVGKLLSTFTLPVIKKNVH